MINQKIDFSIGKTISILVVFYTIRKKNLWLNTYIYSNEWKLLIWRQSASMKNEVIIKIAEWLHDDALFLD